MSRMLEIDSRIISDDTDCYVIAEIGHNHQGDMTKAKLMFDAVVTEKIPLSVPSP